MLRKVFRKLKKSYAKRFKKKFLFQAPLVGNLVLDGRDSLSRDIYSGNLTEMEEQRTFLKILAEQDKQIFLDVGSNYGLFSLLAARKGIREIHAFEPNPKAYCQLAGNLYLNDLYTRIKTWEIAASDASGEATIHIDPASSDVASLSPENMPDRWDYSQSHTCRTEPLDALFDFRDRRLFVKIDVEGHEAKALEGMKSLITGNVTDLMIEILPGNENILATLRDMGLVEIARYGPNYILTNRPSV